MKSASGLSLHGNGCVECKENNGKHGPDCSKYKPKSRPRNCVCDQRPGHEKFCARYSKRNQLSATERLSLLSLRVAAARRLAGEQ